MDMTTADGMPIIPFGPDATCTLELCPVEYSIFRYRPSLAANSTFIVLYFVLMVVHFVLGLRLGSWWFSACVVAGCVSNIAGYGARVLLWQNPFSFAGFLVQIIFVGSAPVWYTAAIYVTMTRLVERLDASLSRIRPRLYYLVFIFSDFGALTLQAVGGAVSTVSSGSNAAGVDLALAGLVFQVFTTLVFLALLVDYLARYFRRRPRAAASPRLRLFLASLSAAVVLILVRCGYRVAELSEGYSGTLFHDEGLFIGLEGVLIVLAVLALCTAHPGLVFNGEQAELIKGYSPMSAPAAVESGIELVAK